jgi:hypothetical protein
LNLLREPGVTGLPQGSVSLAVFSYAMNNSKEQLIPYTALGISYGFPDL